MGGEIIIYWLTGLVTHTECLENIWIEKGVFRLVTSVGQRKSPYEFFYKVHMTSVWGSIPHGNSEFFPCPTLVTRCKNIFFYFFTKLNTYHLSYYIHKYGAIDIADPSSIQDVCHMNFVVDFIGTVESLTVESPWLSSRATKRGIWRSEIRFLMGTQNFSFVPRSWQDEKVSFSISLPSSKLAISLIPIFEYLVLKREEFVYHEARASDWPICRRFNYLLKWVIRPVNGQNWVLLLFNDNIWAYDFYGDNFFYLMTELQIYNLLYSTVFIL